jgi:hypothetical protein
VKYLRERHAPLYHALADEERDEMGAFVTVCGQHVPAWREVYVALYLDPRITAVPCVRCEVALGSVLPRLEASGREYG